MKKAAIYLGLLLIELLKMKNHWSPLAYISLCCILSSEKWRWASRKKKSHICTDVSFPTLPKHIHVLSKRHWIFTQVSILKKILVCLCLFRSRAELSIFFINSWCHSSKYNPRATFSESVPTKSKVLVHPLWIWLREHMGRIQENLRELKVKRKNVILKLSCASLPGRSIFLFIKIAVGRFPILWKSTKR